MSDTSVRNPKRSPDSAPPGEPAQHGGTILVIDDFEFDREFLARGLGKRGYRILQAETGEEGLEILAKEKIHLLCLDSALPGLDGPEVLALVRERYSRLELPVIMVTGMGQSEAVVEGLRLGANDYITKPVDLDVIDARVQSQLSILRLREALHAEKEFSSSLIESAHDMIIASDMEHRITLFNKAAQNIFGYSPDEVMGRDISELFEDKSFMSSAYEAVLRDDGFGAEVTNRKRNGENFTTHLSVSVQRDSQGTPLGVVSILKDLSEVRRLEKERERLIKTKEEFLAVASHDLKNPVGTILGYAWMLEGDLKPGAAVDDETHSVLRIIRQNAHVLQRIIENFLSFHTLEEGRLRLREEAVKLDDVATEIIQESRYYAEQKNIALELQKRGRIRKVKADRDKISQVIRNFVDNAIKFCPKDSRVQVELAQSDHFVELAVSDNGPGLTEDDIAKAFHKYQKLSATPTNGEKSSGLGLSICKQIVELHGGEIGVRQNGSGGATFWFRLA